MTSIDTKIRTELTRFNKVTSSIIQKDWDVIWVLTGAAIRFDDIPKENDTLRRFKMGIKIARSVTKLRLEKNRKIQLTDIQKVGPTIYLSGYNTHNLYFRQCLQENFFERVFGYPKENILVGGLENIRHTDDQFALFPKELIRKSSKIILVTDGFHIPRCLRYYKKYIQKFKKDQLIFYPASKSTFTDKRVLEEMEKIKIYQEKGILQKESDLS